MKIIKLLNKIANGEAPKRIKFNEKYYMWNNSMKDYEEENSYNFLVEELETEELNDEVEIIEEDKKIEKLEYNKVLHDGTEDADLPDEYYCEDCYIGIKGDDETNIRLKIINKINEIIDCINKEK